MSSDSYPRFLAQLESRLGGTSNSADYLEIRNRNGGDVMRRRRDGHGMFGAGGRAEEGGGGEPGEAGGGNDEAVHGLSRSTRW